MTQPAKKTTKKQKRLTREELLLKLDQELSEVHHTLVVALNDLVGALTNIIEHIFGENFILDIWWDWHGGPTIFIRPTGSVQDTMGGLDIDIEQAIDAGYMPLSVAIQDRLEYIGMSWYDVRPFSYEYYMPEKELDVFIKEFNKPKRKKTLLKINKRFSIAYDAFVDVCNELTNQVQDILARVCGKGSILDAWWDWYYLGPDIFIKLAPDSQDMFESGPIPLSDVITDYLCNLGMSRGTVRIWGHERYVSQGESNRFAQKLGKLINSKIKAGDKHV